MIYDKLYRKTIATLIDDCIPKDVIRERNAQKSWGYGYNKEFDIVVISTNGTIGDIYDIGGLLIAIPEKPDDSKIGNAELKRHLQKWERLKVPTELANFNSIYDFKDHDAFLKKKKEIENKHIKFIEKDISYIKHGYWFYNDGEPCYITGGNYYFLQHYFHYEPKCYGDFRMPIRDYYYWLEACYADNRCVGSLLMKNRGVSFSTTGASEIIRETTLNSNSFAPLISKTEDDAGKLFSQKVLESIRRLPIHLVPVNNSNRRITAAIHFTDPKTGDGNNSSIEKYPTTVDAYDGLRPRKSLNDEIGKFKWKKSNVLDFWAIHKDCHTTGIKEVTGKAICGSTAGEFKNGGGKYYKELFDASDIRQRNGFGQTESGLYGLYIPAEFGQQGFYDEYGWVIYHDPEIPIKTERGTTTDIGVVTALDMVEEGLKHNEDKLNAQRRKHPRRLSDAFKDEDEFGMFNANNLDKHDFYLKSIKGTSSYNSIVTPIKLYWENGVKDTRVLHSVDSKGKFLVSWIPPKDMRNLFTLRSNTKYPENGHIGAFGCDSYDAAGVKGSKGSLVGLTKTGKGFPNETFFIIYNHRPKDEYEFYDDVIKAMVFYSMPVLVENNKISLLKHIKARGYRGFAMNRPDVPKSKLNETELKYGGMPSSTTTVPLQEGKLEYYIEHNVGQEDLSLSTCKVMFPELISSWKNYDTQKRKFNDMAVASQFALLANQREIEKKEVKTSGVNITLNVFKRAI